MEFVFGIFVRLFDGEFECFLELECGGRFLVEF